MVINREGQKALARALRYLSARPRSEAEIEKRLLMDHNRDVVNRTIKYLRAEGLVDDNSFAQAWVRSRIEYRPRSAALIRKELAMKGVNRTIYNEVTSDLDDGESAYNLVTRKLHSSSFSNYSEFYTKVRRYLTGKGFTYGVISHTAHRCWDESRK
tara:strand:- start:15 stop:482 length:468 start_codon:yes stop_codon:yes gene_type:complete